MQFKRKGSLIMWEALASVVRVFLEKYLIQTVVSIVAGICTLLFLPEKYLWMTEKIGKVPFVILISGVVFLALCLLMYLYNRITNYKMRVNMIITRNKERIRESEKDINDFMTFFDGVPEDERELIVNLIKNNNTPLKQKGIRYSIGKQSVYDTNVIVKTQNKDGSNLIKINPLVFDKIKEIYEKHGSISHF